MASSVSIEGAVDRALVARGFDTVILVGRDGLVRWRRNAATAPGDIPDDSSTGEMILGRIHPDDLPRVVARMERLLAEPGLRLDTDVLVHAVDDPDRWHRFIGMSISTSAGDPLDGIIIAGHFAERRTPTDMPSESVYSLAAVAPIGLGLLSGVDHLVWCNPVMTALTHLTPGVFAEVPAGHAVVVGEIARLAGMSRAGFVPTSTITVDGHTIRIRAHCIPTSDAVMISVEDITAEVAEQRARANADRLFAAAFDSSPAGIAIMAADGTFERCNPAWTTITGYRNAELVGRHFAEITYSDDLAEDEAHVASLVAGTASSYGIEKRYLHRGGGSIWVDLRVAIVREDGEPHRFVSTIVDITGRKQAEESLLAHNAELRHRADHDWLTGLPNRAAAAAHLEALLTTTSGRPVVLYCDLDRFKAVNDAGGHAAGDAVLIEVASRLRDACRPDAFVARVGGDEFLVVANARSDTSPGAARDIATDLARTIITRISAPIALADTTVTVGVSIGSTVATPTDDLAGLVASADALAYGAKLQGGGHRHG